MNLVLLQNGHTIAISLETQKAGWLITMLWKNAI